MSTTKLGYKVETSPEAGLFSRITFRALLIGIGLSVIIGMATVFISAKTGITAVHVPAATALGVILLRTFFRGRGVTLEESVLTETMATVGGSVAAVLAFTLPGLPMLGYEIPILQSILVALIGASMGVVFTTLVYEPYIVLEKNLPFPFAKACSAIHITGQDLDKEGIKNIRPQILLIVTALSAIWQYLIVRARRIPSAINLPGKYFAFSYGLSPGLIAMGYLCGWKIAFLAIISLVSGFAIFIPALIYFGYAPDITTAYNLYLQPIGIGAVVAGGLVGFLKLFPTIMRAFRSLQQSISSTVSRALPLWVYPVTIIIASILITLISGANILVSFLGATSTAIGVIVATRASAEMGLAPLTGMTLFATMLVTPLLGNAWGATMFAALVCGALHTDFINDLKVGYDFKVKLSSQIIVELLATIFVVIPSVFALKALAAVYVMGSPEMPAPTAVAQTALIKSLLGGTEINWIPYIVGAVIGSLLEYWRPSWGLMIGLNYLLGVRTLLALITGGIIKRIVERVRPESDELWTIGSAGVVSGEGVIGILNSFLMYFKG